MKLSKKIVAVITSPEWRKKNYTVAGLPLPIAIVYVALFAVAFWIYSVVWDNAPFLSPDSPGYIRIANDLSDFRVDQLNARPPGYPFLLVFTGTGRPLFLTSLALHFASIWLISVVLYIMGLRQGWLFFAALLLLLPPYVEYAAYVLSDNLSEFLLVVSFSSLVFWRLRGSDLGLILSSVAVACSGLTRPTYQILAFVVSGFLVIFRVMLGAKAFSNRSWIKAAVILLVVSVVFIGGYSLMNYVKFNFFGIYPMTGFNFANRTVRVVERLPDQYMAEREVLIRARDAQLIERGGDHTGNDYIWEALPELVKITGLTPIPDLAQYLLRLQLILIREAPLHYIQEFFAAFSGYWLPSATQHANMNSPGIQMMWAILHFAVLAIFTLQLFVISGLAIFQLTRRFFAGETSMGISSNHLFTYFLGNTIIFFNAVASSIAGAPDPRYRIPTESLIIFVCFLGFFIWRGQLFCTSSRKGTADP